MIKTQTPFCFCCYSLRVNVKKNIEKKVLASADAQKRLKTASCWNTLPRYLPNQKNKFPVKFIFT